MSKSLSAFESDKFLYEISTKFKFPKLQILKIEWNIISNIGFNAILESKNFHDLKIILASHNNIWKLCNSRIMLVLLDISNNAFGEKQKINPQYINEFFDGTVVLAHQDGKATKYQKYHHFNTLKEPELDK